MIKKLVLVSAIVLVGVVLSLIAQTSTPVGKIHAVGGGWILVKTGPGIFNIGLAQVTGATLDTGTTPPTVTITPQSSEVLSSGQEAQVGAMIAAATDALSGGQRQEVATMIGEQSPTLPTTVRSIYYLTIARADFNLPEGFDADSLLVFSGGSLQAVGPEPVAGEGPGADYQLVDSTVHFWSRSVPQSATIVQIKYLMPF